MIRVESLTKCYGDLVAIDNLNFTVGRGEIVGFLGPNAAGKTTTLRIVTGYMPPTKGKCFVNDMDVLEHPTEVKELIGYLPENNPLYGEMEVTEYLEFIGRIRKVNNLQKRLKDVIELCALDNVIGRNIGELSHGYRQRVGLAQAILHDPEILIADEPTSGLDPLQVVEIRNMIKEFGKKKTVILSTHVLPEVEATCNRVIIIHRGKIVADGSKDQIGKLSTGEEIITLHAKGDENTIKNDL